MPTKRELRDFPESFFQIADHFMSSREPIIVDVTLREARSVRQDFYRFVTRVRRGVEDGDDFCKTLLPAINDLEVSIKPAKGEEFTPVKMRFLKNAMKGGLVLTKAWNNQPIAPEKKESEPPAPQPQDEDLIDLSGLGDLLSKKMRDRD